MMTDRLTMRAGYPGPVVFIRLIVLLGLLLFSAGCQSAPLPEPPAAAAADLDTDTPPPTLTATLPPSATPSATPEPAPTATRTPAPTATPTVRDLCRIHAAIDNPYLLQVSRAVALPRTYEPTDLVEVTLDPANRYFYTQVVRLREPVVAPLLAIIAELNLLGLRPIVISGYRSYTEQVLAFQKWQSRYPDRVDNLSAQPGHSEHQLGTVVDFSTFDMLYEQFNIRFATTEVGRWLDQYAADYGFVLSYPEGKTEITGYEWEPWHFRYVGPDLAHDLQAYNLTLTEFLATCDTALTPEE